MAKVRPFFGHDTSGGENRIQVKTLWWNTVGRGRYVKFEDYLAHFKGHVNILGIFEGDVDLELELLDHNPNSMQGPCRINEFQGTYELKGDDELHIDIVYRGDHYQPFITPGEGGTFIYGLQLSIWVGP